MDTAGTNTIAGFNRHADGTLTPMSGSPFATGGAGAGSGLASQGALQVAGGGRLLLAVDPGSKPRSRVLRIKAGGARSPRSRAASCGRTESSRSASLFTEALVYASPTPATAAATTPGSGWGSSATCGTCRGSTVGLPDGSHPGDVLFNSTGTNLAGTRVGTSLIDSFRVKSTGRLAAAPGSPYAAQGPGPFGSEFRPTNPFQLFVSNAHGGANVGTVSAFAVAGNGALLVDRILALPRPPDRSLLGGDQP